MIKKEFVVNKLKGLTNRSDISAYEMDIEKCINDHNNRKFSLYSRIPLLAEQINLGLTNLYERLIKTLEYGKDSSSIDIYILKYGEIEGPIRHKEKTSKTTQTLEKYIKKYGEIEGPIKYKEYSKTKSMSMEMCIKRYGEIEGPIKFNEFWNNTGFGTSERAFKKRYGDNWEYHFNKFKKNQGDANTLKQMMEKYGEEGQKIYIERNAKKSKSLSKQTYVQKLLDLNFSYEEIDLKIKERWDNTSLDSFKLRYGDNALQKYNEFIQTLKERNPVCIEYYNKRGISDEIAFELISKIQYRYSSGNSTVSKESLKYFNKLDLVFKKRGYATLYNSDEIGLRLTIEEYNIFKKNRFFFYDFCVPDLNLIIEYHGVQYHDDIDYDSTIGVSVDDLNEIEYNKDFYKKWFAESRGYTVIILRSWKIKEDLMNMFFKLNFTEEEKCALL